jgi:hypothetical protein
MLNLFKRWLFNRSRYVFKFWNGHRTAVADPMVIWRALQSNEDFREDDFKLMKREELRDKIIGKVAGITREVFELKPVHEGGLTELECLDLLKAFMLYSGFQKKSGEQMQTSQPLTESELSDDSTAEPSTSDDSAST